jgi:hypothetical protein
MVTAFLIPAIFIYFYMKSKKEAKKYHDEWITMNEIRKDTLILGTVIHKTTQKQRYYYNKYIFETILVIQTIEGRRINLKRIEPITPQFAPPTIQTGETFTFYGYWDEDYFRFSSFCR